MCSGRVDLAHVLRAFSNGADGVFIGACHLNECNYTTHGNFRALGMVNLGKKLIEHIGLHPDRLKMQFMSGSESNVFVDSVNGFVSRVKELGPLVNGDETHSRQVKSKIAELSKLVPYFKVTLREKLEARLETKADYDDLFTKEEVASLFEEVPSYYIDPAKCQACGTCRRRCPVEAIDGDKKIIHIIDQEKCIKCGTCLEVCPSRFQAVTKISGEPVPPPIPDEARTVVKKKKEKAAESSSS
jgi:coenzyme F420-reducing hydrogenase delta subunit/ferredoxin